jgi:protein arginine kinase activator
MRPAGAAMKCQRCEKPATFHITELASGQHQELHLCEGCAREYLSQAEQEPQQASGLSNLFSQQLEVGKTAEELAKLDQRACPVCGITFYEFRSKGRLGCPHDYVFFAKELEPLLLNVHGETEHTGRRPQKLQGGTDRQTDLIRLRREMADAVRREEYEKASQLRDEIRRIESKGTSAEEAS